MVFNFYELINEKEMKQTYTIVFLADLHTLYDDRIYWKQAISLVKNGYNVHYITIGDVNGKGITKEGIHYLQLKRKKYLPTLLLNFFFKRLSFVKTEYDEALEYCQSIKADLYHIHDARINRILGDLKKIGNNPKFIYDGREPLDKNMKDYRFKDSKIPKIITNTYADYIQNWEYKKIKDYDYIFTVDDGLYNRFKKNVPNVPIKIMYNFTNLKDQRKHLTYEDKIYDAAYVGGLSEMRGALVALKSTKYIVEKLPDYKLLFLGQVYDKKFEFEIKQFIQQNNLEKNVILKDFVPHQEVSDYFNQIKIGLNPLLFAKTHEEIIQIKLFEYMNFGIPIITSNFGYMKKYVLENNVGIAIEPNDEKLLANTILDLLNDRKAFDEFAKNGIKAVDERYNWDIMEEMLLETYQFLLNEKQ